MSTTDDGHWEARDDTAGIEPETRPAGTRRAMLVGGAAAGFALASSGLLPEWLAAAVAADKHPVRGIQRRKEQRRRKQQRHRNHNHNHGHHHPRDEKDKPGAKGFRSIECRVQVTGSRAVKVNSYWWDLDITYFRADLRLIASKTLASGSNDTVDITDLGALWIDDRYFVEIYNPDGTGEVKLKMAYNGQVNQKTGWSGGTVAFDEEMPVGRTTPAMVIDGFSTQATRLDGTFFTIPFKIALSAP